MRVVCASLCVVASQKSVTPHTTKEERPKEETAASCHWRVRRLHGARPPCSRREMSFAAARSAALAGRCEGGPRGPRPCPSPGGAARLSARSARVAARGGCAGGAAVGGRGASAGGLACSVRGVARLGGGGGVDARRAAAATRALGSGDARDGSSYDDKLAAARAARAGAHAAGRVRSGAGLPQACRGGGARRGGRGAGGGGGRAAAVALNRLITQEESPEGLLCLVAEELGNLNDVNVSTAFSKLGKLCRSRSFPRNVAADDRFRGLTVLARAHVRRRPAPGAKAWRTSRTPWGR